MTPRTGLRALTGGFHSVLVSIELSRFRPVNRGEHFPLEGVEMEDSWSKRNLTALRVTLFGTKKRFFAFRRDFGPFFGMKYAIRSIQFKAGMVVLYALRGSHTATSGFAPQPRKD